MRTIIDIPDVQVKFLDELSKKKKVSRAEIVRQALNSYITDCVKNSNGYKTAFGSWKDKGLFDSLSYQRKLRDEWVR